MARKDATGVSRPVPERPEITEIAEAGARWLGELAVARLRAGIPGFAPCARRLVRIGN